MITRNQGEKLGNRKGDKEMKQGKKKKSKNKKENRNRGNLKTRKEETGK